MLKNHWRKKLCKKVKHCFNNEKKLLEYILLEYFFSPSYACRYVCESVVASYRVTMELNFFQLEYVLQYTCEDVGVIIARSNINHPGIISKRFLVIQILELFSPKKQNNDETLTLFLNKLDLQLCTCLSST